MEQSLDKIQTELKEAHCRELELCKQATLAQQNERVARSELSQTRVKWESLHTKHKQFVKQNEQYRTNNTIMEKRLNETQARKSELERELANVKACNNAIATTNNTKYLKDVGALKLLKKILILIIFVIIGPLNISKQKFWI